MNSKACCVETCSSASCREQDRGVTFHRLPKDRVIRKKWAIQAKLNEEVEGNKWNYVCSRHFRKVDFEPYKLSKFALKIDAVPTIFSWGITPLEDLSKIFADVESIIPDEPNNRLSSDTEVKSDTETKSNTSRDSHSEEEAKSDSETSVKETDSVDNYVKGDSYEKIQDECEKDVEESIHNPEDSKLSDETQELDSSVVDDTLNANDEVISEEKDTKVINVIVQPKKRGRKPKPKTPIKIFETQNETGNPATSSKDVNTHSTRSKNNVSEENPNGDTIKSELNEDLDSPKRERKVGRPRSKKRLSLKSNIKISTPQSVDNANSNLILENSPVKSVDMELNQNIAGVSGQLNLDSHNLLNVKLQTPVLEKLNYSPMLKALIEKKTAPICQPHLKPIGSYSPTSYNEMKKISSNYASSDKGAMIPGARVEAKDFSEQWYSARIIEVDQEDMEVLIHYDNWSQRYDEWISISSPRLRILNVPPSAPAVAPPPKYSLGERCLARWSDNRRFPATVQNILDGGKYEVRFDDGFVRILKWQHLFKAQSIAAEDQLISPTACVSPVPYGARKTAPPLPAAPSAPLPPPVHNHLFDPSRDHLGSKEERRDMKRKINVKELFSGKKRKVDPNIIKKKAIRSGAEPGQKKRRMKKNLTPVPMEEIVKMEVLDIPMIEPTQVVADKEKIVIKTEYDSDSDKPLVIVEKKVASVRPTKVQPSPVVKSEPSTPVSAVQKKTAGVRAKGGSRQSSPLHVKKSGTSRVATPTQLSKTDAATEESDLSLLLKDEWTCKWVDNQPVGEVTVLPPLDKGKGVTDKGGQGQAGGPDRLDRMTVKVHDYRLPPGWTKYLTRRCVGNSAGKWDVVLVCPMGKRYRSRLEMRTRLAEADSAILAPYSRCLQDFSVHRKLAKRLGWDRVSSQGTTSGLVTAAPALKKKKNKNVPASANEQAFVKDERVAVNMESIPSPGVSKETEIKSPLGNVIFSKPTEIKSPLAIEPPPLDTDVTPQPALEDGFIYVGSLKVQIIGTLLRCPKEGCLKNFRKDNLLQMHIKHYHSDLCGYLGDTPNVADLAYARTITEDVAPAKPVEKTHKVKERKSTHAPIHVAEPEIPVVVKEETETFNPEIIRSPRTPLHESISDLLVLEQSPKLRTLLLEPKIESKDSFKVKRQEKEEYHDVEDMLKSFKIKHQENDSSKMTKSETKKLKSDGNKKPTKMKKFKVKVEKELTKSQVKMLITKMAEDTDNKGRSVSPKVTETLIKTEQPEPGTWEEQVPVTTGYDIFPTPHKMNKKKIRKRRLEKDGDFTPARKKRKFSKHLDIWHAFSGDQDETRSSFGTPDMSTSSNSYGTPQGAQAGVENVVVKTEVVKHENDENQSTFITDSGEKIKIVHMKREEIINCYCGYGEEDGLMIQCELCLCWQHAICHSIEKESQVPDKYICHICLYPPRGRRSQRHLNNQDWLYEGRLPRLSHQAAPPAPPPDVPSDTAPAAPIHDPNVLNGVAALTEADQRRAATLKKSHQLCGNLLHTANLLHSLRCKIQVSQKKDHPKLYLWSKPWNDETPAYNDTVEVQNVKHEQKMEQQQQLVIESKDTMEDLDLQHTYGINIDEVGESIEVTEVDDMDHMEGADIPKCDNEIELSTSEIQNNGQDLLSSPGGTPIHLPITTSELETFAKSVQQVSAPQPEAAIDPAECRLRLLQHIERTQMLLEARLDSIEAQIAELESQDPSLADDETPESFPRTKQTIQMLLRDLATMEELGMLA